MGQVRYFREEICCNRLYKDFTRLEEDFARYRRKLTSLIVRGDDILKECNNEMLTKLKNLFTEVDKLGYMISLDEQILSRKNKLDKIIEDLSVLVNIKNELKKEIKAMERVKK